MKTLVIEREAVKNNIGVIKERAGEAVIYAVLTGDGQGAGLVELARLLREEGIGRFAVSEPADAQALRKAGLVGRRSSCSAPPPTGRSWSSLSI